MGRIVYLPRKMVEFDRKLVGKYPICMDPSWDIRNGLLCHVFSWKPQ